MPKARKVVVKGQTRTKQNVKRKLRIGNRKNAVSAFSMSTKDLISVLADDNKKRWHKNAAKVLRDRPINI